MTVQEYRDACYNVIVNEITRAKLDPKLVSAHELSKLVLAREQIPRATFEEAIKHLADPGFNADPYLQERKIAGDELQVIVAAVLSEHPALVDGLQNGKQGLLDFLIGKVMRATNGKADAVEASRMISEQTR